MKVFRALSLRKRGFGVLGLHSFGHVVVASKVASDGIPRSPHEPEHKFAKFGHSNEGVVAQLLKLQRGRHRAKLVPTGAHT